MKKIEQEQVGDDAISATIKAPKIRKDQLVIDDPGNQLWKRRRLVVDEQRCTKKRISRVEAPRRRL